MEIKLTMEDPTVFNLVRTFICGRECKVRFESGLSSGSESSVEFYKKHYSETLKIHLGKDSKLYIVSDKGEKHYLKTSTIKSISGWARYIRIETENTVFQFIDAHADHEDELVKE